jgi:hypothetical protein
MSRKDHEGSLNSATHSGTWFRVASANTSLSFNVPSESVPAASEEWLGGTRAPNQISSHRVDQVQRVAAAPSQQQKGGDCRAELSSRVNGTALIENVKAETKINPKQAVLNAGRGCKYGFTLCLLKHKYDSHYGHLERSRWRLCRQEIMTELTV